LHKSLHKMKLTNKANCTNVQYIRPNKASFFRKNKLSRRLGTIIFPAPWLRPWSRKIVTMVSVLLNYRSVVQPVSTRIKVLWRQKNAFTQVPLPVWICRRILWKKDTPLSRLESLWHWRYDVSRKMSIYDTCKWTTFNRWLLMNKCWLYVEEQWMHSLLLLHAGMV